MDNETLTEAVARRLRGQLAERRISQTQLCTMVGWNRMSAYRRLRAETPLDTDDLEKITRATGIPLAQLVFPSDVVVPRTRRRNAPRDFDSDQPTGLSKCA